LYPQYDNRECCEATGALIIKRYQESTFVRFSDRREAGRKLGARLAQEFSGKACIVLGLPRGGVPVAHEVAAALGAPLDVLVVRKLGAPFNPELAVGAIGPGGVVFYNETIMKQIGIREDDIEDIRDAEQKELERRERAYRGANAKPVAVAGKTVIVVDDGIATGSTMKAAIMALRGLGAGKIVVAVPTSALDSYYELRNVADEVVTLSTPDPYIAVGAWYEHFGQTSDEEVRRILALETV